MNISIGGVIEIRLPVAVALKFSVHVVQSFIKGHRKSGVISIRYSRDMTNQMFVFCHIYFLIMCTHARGTFNCSDQT